MLFCLSYFNSFSQESIVPEDSLVEYSFFERIGLDSSLKIYKHPNAICIGYRRSVTRYILDKINFQSMSYDSLVLLLGNPSYISTYHYQKKGKHTRCYIELNYYQSGRCENKKIVLTGDYIENWLKIFIDPKLQIIVATFPTGENNDCKDIYCQLDKYSP